MRTTVFKITLLMILAGFVTGCATTEYHPVSTLPEQKAPLKKEGIYHKVGKGQTLFRIAKAYNVLIDDIIESNGIPNAAAIEVDQLILIPGAKQVQEIEISKPLTAATTDSKGNVTPALDLNKDEFAWPIKGKVIAFFNDRKGDAINRGIDIEVSAEDTVKASREGKVVLSDYLGSWGYTVIIDHGDGFMSVYAQMAKSMVSKDAKVLKGDVIGVIKQLGNKTLLHFEIRKGQIAVNPLYYLP